MKERKMEKQNIDKQQLQNDLRELEARIIELKGSLRKTWIEPIHIMAQRQCKLEDMKFRATERYVLVAWLRGKQHLADAERNQKALERIHSTYKMKEAA